MTFWPAVCYCPACAERFAAETGENLPRIINWSDPRWVRFQHKREEWLVDFAALATGTVKALKPQVSVEHQSSTYLLDWQLGVTEALARQSDFLQGDFYGDALQGSVVRKLLYNLTENLPYGFETSVAEVVGEPHRHQEPPALMSAKAHAAIGGDGAMIFIDAIDPAGTLNPAVYERIGSLFAETERYDACRGGELCQDVGVYLSTISKFDPADNGKQPNDPTLSTRSPHLDAVVNACRALIAGHIPFGVVTKKDLGRLDLHKLLLLPNVLLMDRERSRPFVSTFAPAAACTPANTPRWSTRMASLNPTSCSATSSASPTWARLRPHHVHCAYATCAGLVGGIFDRYPLGLAASQLELRADAGATVLGESSPALHRPQETYRFASIHSNPPGIDTGSRAVVRHAFGLGQAIYVAGELESIPRRAS